MTECSVYLNDSQPFLNKIINTYLRIVSNFTEQIFHNQREGRKCIQEISKLRKYRRTLVGESWASVYVS